MKTIEIKLSDFESLGIVEHGEYNGFRIIGIGELRYLCEVKEDIYRIIRPHIKLDGKEYFE